MRPLDIVLEPTTMSIVVVHVAGELDATSIEQLARCVGEIEPGFTTVILDLRTLTFVDSMGLGCLVRLHRDLDAAARMLQLRNLHGHPRRVVEMTELDGVLHLV